MRVIAGSARRLPLETPRGMATRPTLDREKETLFNMLQDGIYGASFLDLFSGSGQIGIEALSRGAAHACFVEQNTEALTCIRKNLAFTRLDVRAQVMGRDVISAMHLLAQENKQFDYVFMDPPYGQGLERQVLYALADNGLLHEDTMIVVESDLMTEFTYLDEIALVWQKEKRYKTNKHTFLTKG